jgi:hypothetical protein
MNREDANRWTLIINEDLARARRSLMSCYGGDRFLSNRIAENEAILERMAELGWVSEVCPAATEPAVATMSEC